MKGNNSYRADGIHSDIGEYRFMKIDPPHYYIGLALLAEHVYSMDGSRKRYEIPGYKLLNGEETANLLGIEKTSQADGDIIYNFKGFKFNACGCDCLNRENVTILIKKDGGILSCPFVAEKAATVIGKTLGVSSKLAISAVAPFVLFSDLDKTIEKMVVKINELGSGFKAAIYQKEKPDYDALEKDINHILVFAGTDFTFTDALSDWIGANIFQGLGYFSTQYKQAALLSIKLRGSIDLIVGHSLGGGLSSCASVMSDIDAIVFNPAGLHTYGAAKYLFNTDESKYIGHTLSNILDPALKVINPVKKIIDYTKIKKTQKIIKAKSINVTPLCSKTDLLTNTQDNETWDENNKWNKNSNNKLMKLGGSLGFLGSLVGKVLGVGIPPVSKIFSDFLKSAGQYIGFFIGEAISKFILPNTFGDKINIETKGALNLIKKNHERTGHSMELMIDALILDKHDVNNNDIITFQDSSIGNLLQMQWAIETPHVTVMYKVNDRNDEYKYTTPFPYLYLSKIGDEHFAAGWEKHQESGHYNVIVEHRVGTEVVGEKTLKKEIKQPPPYEKHPQAKANSTTEDGYASRI